MAGPWLISYIVLWCLMLALAVAVLAHSRLLGLLHHRFGPAMARPLADGPEVGSRLSRVSGHRLDGSEWSWEAPANGDLLLVFVSPQCKACNDLMPHVRDFLRAEPAITTVLVSVEADHGMNRAYVAFKKLEQTPYVIGDALAASMGVEGTPYAVRLDRTGAVRAKGVVNHFEHLQSLCALTAVPSPDSNPAGGIKQRRAPASTRAAADIPAVSAEEVSR